MAQELIVISINFIIVFGAYFFLFPNIVENEIKKLMFYDFLTSLLSLFIVGSTFWGTLQTFSLFGNDLNWFWFTIITYLIIEIPFSLWYIKKHNINLGE